MTSQTLDSYWLSFQQDHDTPNFLLRACITFARQRISASDPQRDDVAHDASWRAWKHFGTLPADTNFSAWFSRVLTNTLRDHRRKANTRHAYETASLHTPIAEAPFTWSDRDRMLTASGDQREAVSQLLEGNTLDEVADSLNTTVRTLRKRLNTLRKEVKAHG